MNDEKDWTNTRSLWPEPWEGVVPVEGKEDVFGVELRWFANGNLNFRSSIILSDDEEGGRTYQDVDANHSPVETPDWDKAEPFVDGWVKFDGCYHLTFGDGRGYMHLCGQHGMNQLASILNRIRALASQHTEIDW